MPSVEHESLVLLFRNRPALAADLLRAVGAALVPHGARPVLASETIRNVRPIELTADAVVVFEQDAPVLAVVVEVQLSRDEEKSLSWPLYLAALRREHRCPCVLLVLALDESVARWCARPIDLGHPDFVLRPIVVGPQSVPRMVDAARAADDVELAVLSAVVHGNESVELVMRTVEALDAVHSLDDMQRAVYFDLVLGALRSATRAAVEAAMSQGKYEFKSDFAKRYIAVGRDEGRVEGRAEGVADALLRMLSARGITVDEASSARIRSCRDVEILGRWIDRAATASTLEHVFGDTTS
jgi:hypothetical protein